MYISFTYKCKDCGKVEDRFIKKAVVDDQYCDSCDSLLHRLPANPSTTFRFADTKLKD